MSLPFALVRSVTGVPTVANFANMDGVPIVIDDSTGDAYTLVSGSVTKILSSSYAIAAIGTSLTNSLSGDVALNNTANYFDGPSVAQGTVGTWFVSGTVSVTDTAGAAGFSAKLWDGTTLISSASTASAGVSFALSISLSGTISSPAANIRISVKDTSSTSGKILFNNSGNSKDSTITVVRIA